MGSHTLSSYRGRYQRVIGKAVNARGQLVPRKFLLGKDEAAAVEANRRLEMLWEQVVAEHEEAVAFVALPHDPHLVESNRLTGTITWGVRRDLSRGPVWREDSLCMAESVRRGKSTMPVPIADGEALTAYFERVIELSQRYPVMQFTPASAATFDQARKSVQADASSMRTNAAALVSEAQQLETLAEVPTLVDRDQPTLHEALEAYAGQIEQERDTDHNRVEAASIRRLKDAIDDRPLDQFNRAALEEIRRYWTGRPLARSRGGKTTGRPISLHTVDRQLKVTRRFVRWLDLSEANRWVAPRYADHALKANLRTLRTGDELAAIGRGVAVFSVEHLELLYASATPIMKMLMLVALNIAGSQAELSSLRINEIVRGDNGTAVIKRVRRKSGVFGEFAVWPETLSAIDWHLRTTRAQRSGDVSQLLLVHNGKALQRQMIANSWGRLLDRANAGLQVVPRLPFKHLRKTAAQMVRQHSNGEIAGVFLSHGTPVRSDDLADVYTNRPFDAVSKALAAVRLDLEPMLAAGQHVFEITLDKTSGRRKAQTPQL